MLASRHPLPGPPSHPSVVAHAAPWLLPWKTNIVTHKEATLVPQVQVARLAICPSHGSADQQWNQESKKCDWLVLQCSIMLRHVQKYANQRGAPAAAAPAPAAKENRRGKKVGFTVAIRAKDSFMCGLCALLYYQFQVPSACATHTD